MNESHIDSFLIPVIKPDQISVEATKLPLVHL